jgi:phage-related protein
MNVSVIDEKTKKFIMELELSSRSKVSRLIDLLERYGEQIGSPHSKKLTKDIFELRTIGGLAVRLLYVFHDRGAMILHGYIKKTQKTPIRELMIAERKLRLLRHI